MWNLWNEMQRWFNVIKMFMVLQELKKNVWWKVKK